VNTVLKSAIFNQIAVAFTSTKEVMLFFCVHFKSFFGILTELFVCGFSLNAGGMYLSIRNKCLVIKTSSGPDLTKTGLSQMP